MLINGPFASGSGLFVGRTPRDWLWEGQDPLLQLLGAPNSHSGFFYAPTFYSTIEEARKFPKTSQPVFLGGSKQQLKDFLTLKMINNNDTVFVWGEQIKVEGYMGGEV